VQNFLAYAEAHSTGMKAWSWLLIAVIALVDWKIGPELSLGFLYTIPVLLISALISRSQIAVLAVVCSLLLEQFHPAAWDSEAVVRVPLAIGGFALAGLFVAELERDRRLILVHLAEVERQTELRRDIEHQMRVLMETSPLGILTLDTHGRVVIANRSAQEMLGYEDTDITGADIRPYLPILERLLRSPRGGNELRTTVESKGHRRGGEVFLAHLWLSTYTTASGPALAAVVWDASENLRDREGTGLDSMMETSRVLIGAFSHEIRNLSAAAGRTFEGLRAAGHADSPEYQTLGAILSGLERVASTGLQLAASRAAVVADLGTVLDETRIVIEPSIRESGGEVHWQIARELPLVRADHHSLLQVLLNLARNSEEAMQDSFEKRLDVTVTKERDLVLVRFQDSGCGVSDPDSLFRPFHSGAYSAGLGLYVSRAILRAHGGDLRCEPQQHGACFVIELWPAEEARVA